MTKQEQSFKMAKRLKNLREERSLSHDKLKAALFEQYGIKISRDSLMSYEIQTEPHSKIKDGKYPNLNMGVEYLNAFAQFYGVSTDYLLGLSNQPTIDAEAAGAAKYTGLSVDAIKLLQLYKSRYIQLIDIFNDLILDKHFWHSIDCLRYAKYAKANSDKKMSDELEKLHIEIGIVNSFERNPNATTITAEQMVDLNLFLASQDFTECAKRIISFNDGEQEGEDGQH